MIISTTVFAVPEFVSSKSDLFHGPFLGSSTFFDGSNGPPRSANFLKICTPVKKS